MAAATDSNQNRCMSDQLSIMELRALYVDETATLSLIREQNTILAEMKYPGKNLIPCGAVMKQRRKKGRKSSSWRCGRRTCRKEMTIRAGNPFFYYVTNPLKRDSKLDLRSILELIWYWLHTECPIRAVAAETKHSAETIVD